MILYRVRILYGFSSAYKASSSLGILAFSDFGFHLVEKSDVYDLAIERRARHPVIEPWKMVDHIRILDYSHRSVEFHVNTNSL